MKNIEISIIYVFYKNIGNLKSSILSVRKYYKKSNYEIIVVNNDISVDLKKRHRIFSKGITIINSKENLGYGGGNNLGVKYAKGRYLLILNPDTEIENNSIENLYNFIKNNKGVGAVAPNLLDEKGKIYAQLGSRYLTPLRGIFALSFINRLFPNNYISKSYYLYNLPPDEIREADAIPGSAFLIRKDVFEKAGRFDENIFLYFEENDLGRRIRHLGYKLYIIPYAQIIHKWKVNRMNKSLQNIFNKSRFYYFKKHFGVLNALIVEFFCRLSKYNVFLILILLLSIFLRSYKVNELFILDSETADNLLDIKNSYFQNKIPLLGPPTSHPWLYFGPLFYWLYEPFLVLFKFNPISHAYFGFFVNTLLIVVNYFVVKKYFEDKTALVSSLLISISPYLLSYFYLYRFYTYTVIFSYLTLVLLFKYLNEKKNIFWLFLSVGILLNFHYSAIVLIPSIILLIYFQKIHLSIKDYYKIISGLLIPLIPPLIYDLKNNLFMSRKILIWFPYRVLTVVGIIPNNNISNYAFFTGGKNAIIFIGNLFININARIELFTGLILSICILLLMIKSYRIIDNNTKYLLFIILISLLFLILHGNTPNHYFLVISAYLLIFISKIFSDNISKISSIPLIFILISLSLFNIIYFINNKNRSVKSKNNSVIYYSDATLAADFIYKDSKNKPIAIRRFGENDNFDKDFAQNYQYLLWLKGNEPVKVGDSFVKKVRPEIQYIILENELNDFDIINYEAVTRIGKITILKDTL